MTYEAATSAWAILEAFLPYYRKATLTATTDPNLVYDLRAKLGRWKIRIDVQTQTVCSAVAHGISK